MKHSLKKQSRNTKFLFKIKQRIPSFLKHEVTANFTPTPDNGSIMPVFNTDQHYYTPAFILPAYPLQQSHDHEAEHKRRVEEAQNANPEMVI